MSLDYGLGTMTATTYYLSLSLSNKRFKLIDIVIL